MFYTVAVFAVLTLGRDKMADSGQKPNRQRRMLTLGTGWVYPLEGIKILSRYDVFMLSFDC